MKILRFTPSIFTTPAGRPKHEFTANAITRMLQTVAEHRLITQTLKQYQFLGQSIGRMLFPSTQKNWCSHAQTHLFYLTCARSLRSPFSQDLSLLLEPDHTLRGNERHQGTILENGVSFGVLNFSCSFGYSYLRFSDLIFAFSRVFLAYPSGSLHRLPIYLFIGGRIVGSGQGVVFET